MSDSYLAKEEREKMHKSYPGNLKKLLSDINNARQVVDVVNPRLNSVGVVGTSSVQKVLVLLNLTLSPLPVRRATVLGNATKNAKNAENNNGLLVHYVELVADGSNGKTRGGGKDSRLGDQAAAGNRVEDRLGLLLGVFRRDVGGVTGRGEVGSDGSETAGGENGWPHSGGTWVDLAKDKDGNWGRFHPRPDPTYQWRS